MRITRFFPAMSTVLILCFGVASSVHAADPIFTDVIGSTGMSYTGGTEGDGSVLVFNGKRVVLLSRHGGAPWKGFFLGKAMPDFAFALPTRDRHGCTAADLAGLDASGNLTGPDGKDDLFCQIGACQGTCTKAYPKELWIQTPTGFIDKASAARVDDPHARGRDSASYRLPDGTRILVTANETSSLFPQLSMHKVYHVHGGVFSPIQLVGIQPVTSAFQCVVTVPHGSGYPDLFFCQNNKATAYRYNGSAYAVTDAYPGIAARDLAVSGNDVIATTATGVFILRAGKWAKIAALVDGARVTTGDMDCNGTPDIIVTVAKGGGNHHKVFLNNSGGTYRAVALPAGNGTNGDTPTFVPNWDGKGHPAVGITNGMWGSGADQWITSSCTR